MINGGDSIKLKEAEIKSKRKLPVQEKRKKTSTEEIIRTSKTKFYLRSLGANVETNNLGAIRIQLF